MSMWTHVFQGEDKGHFALYHSLGMDVLFLENCYHDVVKLLRLGTTSDHLRKRYPNLSEQLEEVFNELRRTGMIVPVETDDMKLLEEKRADYVLPPGLETLYLLVTDRCNLRCHYCFINNNMPEDYKHARCPCDREGGNRYVLRELSRNPPEYARLKKTIFFYGGEPLLNFSLLRKLLSTSKLPTMRRRRRWVESFACPSSRTAPSSTKTLRNSLLLTTISTSPSRLTAWKRCMTAKGLVSMAADHLQKRFAAISCSGRRAKPDVSLPVRSVQHNIDRLPELLQLHRQYGFASINLNPLTDTAQNMVSEEYMRAVSGG